MIGARSSLRLSASANIAVDATRMHATNAACKPRDTKHEGSPAPPARIHSVAGMSRRALALAALACSLVRAGCGVNHHDIVASTVIPTPRTADIVGDTTVPADTRAIRHVTIVVLDRLSSDPVAGATVTLGSISATTDKDGIASFPKLPHSHYIAQVEAKGYDTQHDPIRLRPTHRFAIVRVWRPGWSWPVYGGDPARTQSPSGISLRPHLRMVWGRKLGGLIEFPPVTAQGIGYVTTARGTLTAFETDTGNVVWRRPLNERMGASPGVAGRARVRRLVQGADPRVRRDRRPAALAEGARRGERELAAGRRRPPPVRGQ